MKKYLPIVTVFLLVFGLSISVYITGRSTQVATKAAGDVLPPEPRLSGDEIIPIGQSGPLRNQAFNTRGDGYLDVVFFGDKFGPSEVELFNRNVESYKAELAKYSPFQYWGSRIKFYTYLNNSNLNCRRHPDLYRCVVCYQYSEGSWNYNHIYNQLIAAGIPWDVVVVIHNDPDYGGCADGRIAAVSNENSSPQEYNQSPQVFVHEFGHAAFSLADEYLISNETNVKAINTSDNCYKGNPPNPNWLSYLPTSLYSQTRGCMFPDWYRSSESSIMKELNARYFNAASIFKINSVFELISNSNSFVSTPVEVNITSPANNEPIIPGTRDLVIQTLPSPNLHRLDIIVDDVFVKPIYKNYQYSTYTTIPTSTIPLSTGTHRIRIRAIDIYNQTVGISSEKTYNILTYETPRCVNASISKATAEVGETVIMTATVAYPTEHLDRIRIFNNDNNKTAALIGRWNDAVYPVETDLTITPNQSMIVKKSGLPSLASEVTYLWEINTTHLNQNDFNWGSGTLLKNMTLQASPPRTYNYLYDLQKCQVTLKLVPRTTPTQTLVPSPTPSPTQTPLTRYTITDVIDILNNYQTTTAKTDNNSDGLTNLVDFAIEIQSLK